MARVRIIAFASLVALAATNALACTIPEQDAASPRSLVERADAIYRVRADGYLVAPTQRKSGVPPLVRFSLLDVLKGKAPNGPLQFAGILVRSDDPNTLSVPYRAVRPAGHGRCFATEYRRGGEYLLFVKAGTPYWARLAPTNEQLFGGDDPWLKWVKLQIGANN